MISPLKHLVDRQSDCQNRYISKHSTEYSTHAYPGSPIDAFQEVGWG